MRAQLQKGKRNSRVEMRAACLAKGLNWEPQKGNGKNMVGIFWECKDPGGHIPIVFLLSSWGSLFWSSQ